MLKEKHFQLLRLSPPVAERGIDMKKKFLYKSATFLYSLFIHHLIRKTGVYAKVEKNIMSLHPGKDKEELVKQFYIEKIRLSSAIILVGTILALISSLILLQTNQKLDGVTIPRNNWQQGSYTIDVKVTFDNQDLKPHQMTLVIEPVSLTEEEVTKLAGEVFGKLAILILGKNPSLSQVTESLNLYRRLDGYPFTISWIIDKPSLVKANGFVNNHLIESDKGEWVKLTALLHYQDQWSEYRYNEDFYVKVLPYLIAEADELGEAIIAAVYASQQETVFADTFKLPAEIKGNTVSWHEVKTKDSLVIWLLVFAAAIITFAAKDQDIQKKVNERNKQIDRDYPELVRKLALYLGAGMTLRGAWKRVAWDYDNVKGKVRFLYEEMLFSVRELENGIPEREVYESFGKRVGIAKYRKLMGLLCNHLQKGNKNLLQVLQGEMELALEDRKKAARTIGEEMSTKLLLPMMLMLLIVIIVIMVPAFQMF